MEAERLQHGEGLILDELDWVADAQGEQRFNGYRGPSRDVDHHYGISTAEKDKSSPEASRGSGNTSTLFEMTRQQQYLQNKTDLGRHNSMPDQVHRRVSSFASSE